MVLILNSNKVLKRTYVYVHHISMLMVYIQNTHSFRHLVNSVSVSTIIVSTRGTLNSNCPINNYLKQYKKINLPFMLALFSKYHYGEVQVNAIVPHRNENLLL